MLLVSRISNEKSGEMKNSSRLVLAVGLLPTDERGRSKSSWVKWIDID